MTSGQKFQLALSPCLDGTLGLMGFGAEALDGYSKQNESNMRGPVIAQYGMIHTVCAPGAAGWFNSLEPNPITRVAGRKLA